MKVALALHCPKCEDEVRPHKIAIGIEDMAIEATCVNPECGITSSHVVTYQDMSILAFCQLAKRPVLYLQSQAVH